MLAAIFTIAICTFNRHDLLSKAIASALNQHFNAQQYEIVIVDNSTDKNAATATQKKYKNHPHITYLINDVVGLSSARNRCIQESNANYIAFLDDDAVAEPEWLSELYACFQSNEGHIGVVGGQVRPNWEIRPPEWLLPAEICDQDINNHMFPMVGNFSLVNWGGDARPLKAGEWLAGANIAFQKKALEAAGNFNVNLGRNGDGYSLMSNEETELIERIRKNKLDVLYAPKAMVTHFVPKERISMNWLIRRVAWQVVSDLVNSAEKTISSDAITNRIETAFASNVPRLLCSESSSDFRNKIMAYAALIQTMLTGDVDQLDGLSFQYIHNKEKPLQHQKN